MSEIDAPIHVTDLTHTEVLDGYAEGQFCIAQTEGRRLIMRASAKVIGKCVSQLTVLFLRLRSASTTGYGETPAFRAIEAEAMPESLRRDILLTIATAEGLVPIFVVDPDLAEKIAARLLSAAAEARSGPDKPTQ